MVDEPQLPPTIELEGARLRPLRRSDAEALFAYLREPSLAIERALPTLARE